MTENTKDSSAIESKSSAQLDQTVEARGETIDQTNDTVAYDTYRRAVSEAKKFKSVAAELRAEKDQFEQSRLEAEGKYKELNDRLRKENESLSGKYKDLEGSIVNERVTNQVAMKAKELGCINTEDLIKLMDIKELDLVDGYKVSEQSLEMVLKQAKETKPYLFNKPAPIIHDGAPSTKVNSGNKAKITSDKSISELKAMAIEIDRKEGKSLGF